MSSTSELIENILNVFVFCRERTISLDDLQSQLKITSTPVDLIQLNKILRDLKPLFVFTNIGVDLAVSVEISLEACPSYNSRGCEDPDCEYLHVCEKHLKSTDGCRGSCRLLHSFDSAEIKTKLIKDRFDYNLLMNFYQIFYVPNATPKASAACEDRVDSLEEHCPIEHRRVMVRFSEDFGKHHDQRFFLKLFSQKDEIRGGFIEDLIYKPNEQHAIVTFQKKKVAERLLKEGDVHYDGNMFTITRVDGKQGVSDYISSKSKNRSSSSKASASLYVPSSNKYNK